MRASLFPMLAASDMARARAWYRDHLGWEPTEEVEGEALWYEVGGTRVLVYPSEFAGTNKATALSLVPDDFDAAVGDLRGRGVTFEEYDMGEVSTVDGVASVPDGRKAAWFKDSEGNIFGMVSEA